MLYSVQSRFNTQTELLAGETATDNPPTVNALSHPSGDLGHTADRLRQALSSRCACRLHPPTDEQCFAFWTQVSLVGGYTLVLVKRLRSPPKEICLRVHRT
jgi:hypothetical protein